MDMTPFEEFDALDRIFKLIVAYSQQPRDQVDPTDNELIQGYLIKHLQAPDLQLWLRLEDQNRLAEFVSSSTMEGSLKARLHQFKCAAHGLNDSWLESHSLN